jgi:hypothetical protein
MPDASCTRSLACEKVKAHEVVTEGPAGSSGIPARNGFNGCSGLSLVIGLFCHHRLARVLRDLNASVEASGPHGFAVRFRAVRQRRIHVHRIPPRVRDDREPPLLVGRDSGICSCDLGESETRIFLRRRLDRPNRIDLAEEFFLMTFVATTRGICWKRPPSHSSSRVRLQLTTGEQMRGLFQRRT